jgi:hypothetical protein
MLADSDYLAREVASLRTSLGELATRDFVRSELRETLEMIVERLDRIEVATSVNEEPAREDSPDS